jgi:23S rRNA (uridine2552-2'-O)-methyltransferase
LIKTEIGGHADLVMSDMAPNITGVTATDQARALALAELAADFAETTLHPGGALLVKVFQGAGFPALRERLRKRFTTVVTRKPAASRSESREVFLLAKGLAG